MVPDAGPLQTGGHRRAFVADNGVHVAPGSKLRFCRAATVCSSWVAAGDLRVNEAGVWLESSAKGYAWSDIAFVDVESFDGLSTTGAIIGGTVGAVVVIPLLLLGSTLHATSRGFPRAGSHGGRPAPVADVAKVVVGVATVAAAPTPTPTLGGGTPLRHWRASALDTTARPSPLFTRSARIRSNIALGAAIDGSAAYDRNLVTSGAVARLRLGDYVELGAGARLAQSKHEDATWHGSRLYVAQFGFHAPVTPSFALPVGLDLAWGGDKALSDDVSLTWGLRYTSPSGRWSGTLHPLTPSWGRRDGDWSVRIGAGFELGVTL
ncbi:MAG: hypothetical protein ABI867_38410 [Kofleriaceae bacterium]